VDLVICVGATGTPYRNPQVRFFDGLIFLAEVLGASSRQPEP
jgi:hypothetical protein